MAHRMVFGKQADHIAETACHYLKHRTGKVLRDFLVKRGNPQPLLAYDISRVMGDLAADDLHKRGFACPVSAYQADPLPAFDLQRHPVDQFRAAERKPHIF